LEHSAKDELSDADLLELSKRGDEDAFMTLYGRHQGPVFRFALHMSGSRDTAEEVTQDVFLGLLSGLRRYARERGSLQPYLIGMARNHVRRYLKQTAASPPADARQFLPDEGPNEGVDQELALLRAAILKLPSNYRETLVLCDLEGLDYAQAAAHLGCAIGTIRSRLHRARAILASKLRARERCPA
jgi:RNA polymerase sigma-70 factor, ECF subfamily